MEREASLLNLHTPFRLLLISQQPLNGIINKSSRSRISPKTLHDFFNNGMSNKCSESRT